MPPRPSRKRTPSARYNAPEQSAQRNARPQSRSSAKPKPAKRPRTDSGQDNNPTENPANNATPNMMTMMKDMMSTMSSLVSVVQKTAEAVSSLVAPQNNTISQPGCQWSVGGQSDNHAQQPTEITTESLIDVSGQLPQDSQLEAVLNRHSAEIMGTSPQNGNEFVSVALPLDILVSDKLKNKIWSGEYIEMGALLEGDPEGDSYSLRINPGEGGSVNLVPNSKSHKIESVSRWLSAFQIFMSIHCQKRPADFGKLLVYQNLIKKSRLRAETRPDTTPIFES